MTNEFMLGVITGIIVGGGLVLFVYNRTIYPRLQKAAGLMAMHLTIDATKKLYGLSLKKVAAMAQVEEDNLTRNGIIAARDALKVYEAELRAEEEKFYKQTGLPRSNA